MDPLSIDTSITSVNAQILTQNSLKENQEILLETIGRLQERRDSITFDVAPGSESETLRLQEEINFMKQCLEVCQQASNKIHISGIVSEEDCNQEVVTTLADLLHVRKVKTGSRSRGLVGLISEDVLREISKDRYGSSLGGSLETTFSYPIHQEKIDDIGM
jgi:hypothetical protein